MSSKIYTNSFSITTKGAQAPFFRPHSMFQRKSPPEGLFRKHMSAGGGNRNLDYCLEGSRFTTKLRPQVMTREDVHVSGMILA